MLSRMPVLGEIDPNNLWIPIRKITLLKLRTSWLDNPKQVDNMCRDFLSKSSKNAIRYKVDLKLPQITQRNTRKPCRRRSVLSSILIIC